MRLLFTLAALLSVSLPIYSDEYHFDFDAEMAEEEPLFVFPSLNGSLCFHHSCIPQDQISNRQCTYGETYCTARVSGDFKKHPLGPGNFTLYLWGSSITEVEKRALTTPPQPEAAGLMASEIVIEGKWNTEDEVFGLVPSGEVLSDLAAPVEPEFFRETSILDTRTGRTGSAMCNWSLGIPSPAPGRRCIVTAMNVDGMPYERVKIGSSRYLSSISRYLSAGFSGDSDLATSAGHESFLAAIEQRLFIDTLMAPPDLISREDTAGTWSRVFSTGRRLSLIDPQLNEDTEVLLDLIYLGPSFLEKHSTGEKAEVFHYRIKWRVYSFVSRLNSADPNAWTMPSPVFREAYEAIVEGAIEAVTSQFSELR